MKKTQRRKEWGHNLLPGNKETQRDKDEENREKDQKTKMCDREREG